MRTDLPTGTVTFVFTDVESSTKLLRELGAERYAGALAEHRGALRAAFQAHGGVEVDTQGDALFVAFPTAEGALSGVRVGLRSLVEGNIHIRVRVGVHTGTPLVTEEGYVGEDVHRAARVGAAGHGGQVLISAATHALVDTDRFPMRDLGEHRFKDLARPERVYQLDADDFPPIRSLSPSNLPVPAIPFFGRDRELAQVVELLSAPALRLLTLTGPGGTGKTRLAIQAAAESSERFPGGLWWVAMAPLEDPRLVLHEVAGSMGLEERADRAIADAIAERAGGRRTLILLDNAEHLLPRLADEVAPLVRKGGGTTLLVTSRERLRLEAEREVPIPSMAPDDAEAFFRSRAEAAGVSVEPSATVTELCGRLDHLPLAMQLAAARLKVFSVEQLLARLSDRLDLPGARDADARQRTLRATIEWSHDLLDENERALFRRLSAFAGGATIEAIEEVCGADPEVLASLVDKSLIRRRDEAPAPRFWMLETIREFAAERLAVIDEVDAIRDAHARWSVGYAYGWDEAIRVAAERAPLLERMDAELDNIRIALTWASERGDGHLLQELAGGLRMYWHHRGLYEEGRRWLDLANEAGPTTGHAVVRVLDGITSLAFRQGDDEVALKTAEEALPLARDVGDPGEIMSATTNLANALSSAGRLEEAGIRYDEAIALARPSDSPVMLSTGLVNRADFLLIAGRYEQATTALREALEVARSQGVTGAETVALINLATASYHLGRDEDAARYAVEAIDVGPEVADMETIALLVLAGVQVRRGDLMRAATLLGASEGLRKAIGYRFEPTERAVEDRVIADFGDWFSEPDVAAAHRRGRALDPEAAKGLVFEG
jgi:predicted ATPase/class 3 adenylate cyclase/Tfp pilus assembly protein PilF